jgi:hypothetical protein
MEDIRMKLVKFALIVCAIVTTTAAFAQDDQPVPVAPGTPLKQIFHRPASLQNSALPPLTGSTIPTFNYSVVSPVDGKTYAGTIIGVSPAARPAQATVVPTVLVPVRLVFQYSSTSSFIFDPSVADPGCLGAGNNAFKLTELSPIFNDAKFVMGAVNVGTTQYVDAFERANFWANVSAAGGANYHTLLGVAPMPTQVVTIPSANTGTPKGSVFSFSGLCGTNTANVNAPGLLGVMDINAWHPIARSLITKLGINVKRFVLFLFYNAVMSVGNPTNLNNCCVLGYHSSVGSQTYGNTEFEGRNQTLFGGTADTSIMSHEIGEWMDDPLGNNPTPAWGHIGQVGGCQGNLEVGDPLSGTLMPVVKMPNGFSYHLQEMAFFDWFYRISPSIVVNGWYSDNGTFTTGVRAVCQ